MNNEVLSLNEVATEFSVEELEPRMEMQMLGLGTDPSLFIFPNGLVFSLSIFTPFFGSSVTF